MQHTITVTSSDGDFYVSRETGIVLSTLHVKPDHEYAAITRFNLEEWRNYLKRKNALDREQLDSVDILHVGYWHTGGYEGPCHWYRDDCIKRGKSAWEDID